MAQPNMFGVTEFDQDPATAAELMRLKRQQQIADAMYGQSQQPLQGGMVGQTYVAPSITQGLAKLMQGYVSGKSSEGVQEGYKGLADRKAQETANAIAAYKRGTMGTPEQPMGPPTEAGDMGVKPAFTPTSDARRQAIIEAAVSTNPRLSKMGQMDFQLDARKEDKQDAIKARMDELQYRLAEGRITKEEADKRAADLRREMQEAGFAQQRSMAQLAAGLRQPKDEGAPVAVTGPDGKPIYVSKKDAIGKTPAAMDAKAQAIAQRQADGATDVDVALGTLRDAYNRLETGGGITSTGKGAMDNVSASLSSSGIGQGVGKIFGTKNQSARNDIAMARPALLAALMKATGMSSKQLDSNAELKLWLSTATDPTLDVESNRKALDNIEKKYLKTGGASGGWKDL